MSSTPADTEAEHRRAGHRRGVDRRRVLTVGGASAVATAILAACSPGSSRSGDSGTNTTVPAGSTTTPPTAPAKERSETDIIGDTQQAQTLISVELSAVKSYDAVLPHLTLTANREAAQAFRTQHEDAAKSLQAAARSTLGGDASYDKPNEYMDQQVAGPVLKGLESDATNAKGDDEAEQSAEDAYVRFLMNTEGTLASSYLTAVGTVVTKDLRNSLGEHAGPSARRQAVWADLLGTTVPPNAVFSVQDTVPNEALIVDPASKGTPAE